MRTVFWFLAAMTLFPAQSQADVTVAVASNFRLPAEAIAARFEARRGIDVRLVFGSSGKHAASILNGAPIDVFLSADKARPEILGQAGLVAERRVYAIGRLALYAPTANSSAAALDMLETGDFRRLAIADWRVAPYGLAARQVLDRLDLAERSEPKTVIGENISQTFAFVATGNAELGFVALSQVLSLPTARRRGAYVVPPTWHDAITQEAVRLTRSAKSREADAFWSFLFADDAQHIIRSFGYEGATP